MSADDEWDDYDQATGGSKRFKVVPGSPEGKGFPQPRVITDEDLDEDTLPPRRWLKGRSLIRGDLTGIVGDGGVGKSSLELMTAISLITGRETLVGEMIYENGPVWLHNCEDSVEEVRRRLIAILKHFNIPNDDVVNRLFITSGLDNEFIVMRRDRFSGLLVPTPHVANCIEHIKDLGIIYASFDPFGGLVEDTNENSNLEVRKGLTQFKQIAYQTSASIAVDHHTGKAPRGYKSDPTDPNVARGGRAFVDTCRIVQQITTITEADADKFEIHTDDRHLYLRRDNGKINLSLLDGKALGWYKRETITLRNGDDVGVIVPHKFGKGETIEGIEDERDENLILALVERRFSEGQPLSSTPQAAMRYLPVVIAQLPIGERVAEGRAKRIMTKLYAHDRIWVVTTSKKDKTKGLCTAQQARTLNLQKEE
jgi:hypothetical protein